MTPQALKAWRTAAGLTQTAAAALLDAPYKTYENWEQGRRKIPRWVEREVSRLSAATAA